MQPKIDYTHAIDSVKLSHNCQLQCARLQGKGTVNSICYDNKRSEKHKPKLQHG